MSSSSCCLMVELRNEDPRAFTRFMRMPLAMYDEIVQSPYHADNQLESTPLTRPEGGLSKLWIGKCKDQPCAAALCRASDDAERRLSVIRQCYGSGTTVLRPWSARVRQCYRRDAAAVSRSWTWLPVLRQCFSSGAAADGHTTYSHVQTAKHKIDQYLPRTTTSNRFYNFLAGIKPSSAVWPGLNTAPVHVHMRWPVIHYMHAVIIASSSWPHFRQARILTTRRINILTATVQSEIKSNDSWYRPYDDSVISRYIIYDNLVIPIIYDYLVIPRYMMILLYPGIWRCCYTRYMTILLYRAIWRSCYTAVYDDLVIPRYMTFLLYRVIWSSCYIAIYDYLVIPRYMTILLHRLIWWFCYTQYVSGMWSSCYRGIVI